MMEGGKEGRMDRGRNRKRAETIEGKREEEKRLPYCAVFGIHTYFGEARPARNPRRPPPAAP
jgi:hypothetical protein